jgi:hypothetical protein
MRRFALRKIVNALWRLKPRDRIGRPPRMLATDFNSYSILEARIMARYGIRSPSGLKRAMRAYGVDSVEDLINALEHHRPQRKIGHRARLMLQRAVGGTPYDPHAATIRKTFKTRAATPELAARVKRLKTALDHPTD